MAALQYQVLISGELLDGCDFDVAVDKLSTMLHSSPQRIRRLFQGRAVSLGKKLDRVKAEKLKGKIEATGARCAIEPVSRNESETIAEHQQCPVNADDSNPVDKLELQHGSLAEAVSEEQVPGIDYIEITRTGVPGVDTLDDIEELERHDTIIIKATSSEVPTHVGPKRLRRSRLALLASAVCLGIFFVSFAFSSDDRNMAADKSHSVPEEISPTRANLMALSQKVMLWMIQYGDHFDPSVVNLQRVGKDFGLSSVQMSDSWSTPIKYEGSDIQYTLRSAGPDKVFNTEDDLIQNRHI